MSKINRRQKQREFFRMQEQLKEKQRKKSKSLNEGEGMDKGGEKKSSLKVTWCNVGRCQEVRRG